MKRVSAVCPSFSHPAFYCDFCTESTGSRYGCTSRAGGCLRARPENKICLSWTESRSLCDCVCPIIRRQ